MFRRKMTRCVIFSRKIFSFFVPENVEYFKSKLKILEWVARLSLWLVLFERNLENVFQHIHFCGYFYNIFRHKKLLKVEEIIFHLLIHNWNQIFLKLTFSKSYKLRSSNISWSNFIRTFFKMVWKIRITDECLNTFKYSVYYSLTRTTWKSIKLC